MQIITPHPPITKFASQQKLRNYWLWPVGWRERERERGSVSKAFLCSALALIYTLARRTARPKIFPCVRPYRELPNVFPVLAAPRSMMDDYSEDYTHTTPLSRPPVQRRPQNNLTSSAQSSFIAIFGYGFPMSHFHFNIYRLKLWCVC